MFSIAGLLTIEDDEILVEIKLLRLFLSGHDVTHLLPGVSVYVYDRLVALDLTMVLFGVIVAYSKLRFRRS